MRNFIVIFVFIFFVNNQSFSQELKKTYFGGGCFWCMEEAFDKVDGVTNVVSKSAAGKVYAYWQAAWTEGQTRKTAKFSVTRNGDKKALDLAIKAKRKAKRNS